MYVILLLAYNYAGPFEKKKKIMDLSLQRNLTDQFNRTHLSLEQIP